MGKNVEQRLCHGLFCPESSTGASILFGKPAKMTVSRVDRDCPSSRRPSIKKQRRPQEKGGAGGSVFENN